MSKNVENRSTFQCGDFNRSSSTSDSSADSHTQEIKIWVDCSFQSKRRDSGIGIVITDADNNLLEEHSLTTSRLESSFDSELISAVIALSLPSVLKSKVLELHGDCTSVIEFLNAPDEHYGFEDKSEARRELADNAREALCIHEGLDIYHDSDTQKDKAGKLMRRAHFLAKCALQNKPLAKCKFLTGPV